ncbi:MAG: hypothetical protein FWC60_10920 [Firmicutes bacterium]|nr:hypothetical protein [Bacillota bacterium]
MSKFTTGVMIGGLVGVVAMSYAISDNKTRRRMVKGSRRAIKKANTMADGLAELW